MVSRSHSPISSEKASIPIDVEKDSVYVNVEESCSIGRVHDLWSKLGRYEVETTGIEPVPEHERVQNRYHQIFTFFWTMNFCLLSVITGMSATLSYGLSLRDSSLVILFFSLLCSVPPAYLATLGPKTGLRQMIQARYSFGFRRLYGSVIPVILNMATVTGFVVIGAVVGGQTLAAVNPGSVSDNVGIIIICIITLLVSFCGYRVLHQYELYAWIPIFICIIVALGTGGKHLHQQAPGTYHDAPTILSFGGLIAGFFIPYSALASDYATYMPPNAPAKHIFAYAFAGFVLPTVPLMVLGAAIGGAVPNVPEWAAAYDTNSAGGVLAAMLSPAKGFGKFMVVILAFSTLGNMAASTYSVSLNFQMLLPALRKVPRALFSIIIIAVVIPVSIKAVTSFFDSLENFIGVIAYWSAAFVAIVITEHIVFRHGDATTYDPAIYKDARALPTGVAALAAGAMSFALIVPCMGQIWYTGPVAKHTGDIGFEVAFVLTVLLYLPFRWVEIRIRGRL
ncbi:purine-cytosine permease FCY22 [Fistulina hepatica ATCC 64428]|uniref:Purine-cytosine permease FCY22 n=1 Tax=Fistulina hepatica ATCC 64428 TaxID=1128425 RepID=A0A0D7ADK7_9AGAR|nr:purine-cytosine permease FCY22 [Fistulina hepatica ATCC 64428]